MMKNPGCVYLVGAGPGDPELLTVKAHRLIREADVVVYDRLVGPAILWLIPPEVKRVYVGKKAGRHHLPQEQINELLVQLAGEYTNVVRLKGGDPFIFGRGSEEAVVLAQNNVPFQIVPGITAAAGCGAATGIPLSHRGAATSIRFITGHCRNETLDFDWPSLASEKTTLVFYMGLGNSPVIRDHLIAHGMDPKTPAAAVENGTTPKQRLLFSTLDRLPEALEAGGFKPPTLLIIGEVVSVGEVLNQHMNPEERGYAALA